MTPASLRRKLFSPPNAVPDTGINMRNGRPVKVLLRVVDTAPPEPPPIVIPKIKPLLVHNPNPVHRGGTRREDLPPRSKAGLREIRIAVCEAWGISELELVARRRKDSLPRMVAYTLAARLTLHSLPAIGHSFGRDHTTVLHAIRKYRSYIDAVAAELPADAPSIEWARAMKRRIAP